MKTDDFLAQIEAIREFIRTIHKDSMGIKGITPNGHTHLITKPAYYPDGIIKHDKGTCTVYYGDSGYFSIDMSYCEFSCKAIISNDRVSLDDTSIVNFITYEKEFRGLWEIAKSCNLMSIAEKEIISIKAEISLNNSKNKRLKNRIKELETEHSLNS